MFIRKWTDVCSSFSRTIFDYQGDQQDFYGEAGFFSMFAVCKVRLKEIYELFLLCGMTN